MEKYYWNPTREDRVGVCMGIFQEDKVDRREVESLVDAFPGQSIDFFGALRARVYDDKVGGRGGWGFRQGLPKRGGSVDWSLSVGRGGSDAGEGLVWKRGRESVCAMSAPAGRSACPIRWL